MADYQMYINALRQCAKEHDNDRTPTGHIRVSDLCRDTANLLEEIEQESSINTPCDTCGYEEGSIYCKEHCPHEAKIEQEPCASIDVIDKIRAEIDKIYEREGSSFDCLNALDELKEFIDKLQTESRKS